MLQVRYPVVRTATKMYYAAQLAKDAQNIHLDMQAEYAAEADLARKAHALHQADLAAKVGPPSSRSKTN
jgi:hypothetical protein